MLRFLIKKAFGVVNQRTNYNLRIKFADGSTWEHLGGGHEITIVFKKRRAEFNSLLLTDVGFMESYFKGDIDILGEDALREVIRTSLELPDTNDIEKELFNPIARIKRLLYEAKVNNKSFAQAKKNAYFHYNLPAEFFHLFLGETYAYSEAYYHDGDETLDEAQVKKYNYVAKKLLLKPGDKLVEVGSAYGYMSILAAEKYGADVTNYGLVAEQNRVMQEKIDQKNLGDKVRIVVKDHRELKYEPGTYDKFVSLGVHEHAGKDCNRQWIESIATALRPGGVGLISCTTHMERMLGPYLITKHIFPGGYIPSVSETLSLMEEYGLNVVDMESLRHHYYLTSNQWYKNFIDNWDKIQQINPNLFNEYFKRKWSLYLLGFCESLKHEKAKIDVFHIVFTKGRNKEYYPITRDFLYK